MANSIVDLVRSAWRRRSQDDGADVEALEKIDGGLTDNMRALRLILAMSDRLLSCGMAASDVVHIGLGVANTYCSRRVHFDINSNIMTLSQDRGVDREPLTLVRTTNHKGTDYHTMQMLEELGDAISQDGLPLDEAEKRLDSILSRPRLYPRWVSHVGAGGVSAGVVILYSHNPFTWVTAFIVGVLVNMTLYRMAKMGIPSFYSQAAAGLLITLLATLASLLAINQVIPDLNDINPTMIIISGIVLLVAGMMIVSALQDAIDEYYVTAGARLLKVMMMTGGIVVGVTIGLYVATRLGVTLTTTPDRLSLAAVSYQFLGAGVLAASFALGNQARWTGVLAAGLTGVMSLYTMLIFTGLGFGVVPASGVAAAVVGLAATLFSHWFRTPAVATISAGIIPLVPGLTLYSGLIYIAQAAPNTSEFDTGITLLMRAVLIAVVVAAGATFGNIIGRPARRRLIHLQNRLPRRRLSMRQKP